MLCRMAPEQTLLLLQLQLTANPFASSRPCKAGSRGTVLLCSAQRHKSRLEVLGEQQTSSS